MSNNSTGDDGQSLRRIRDYYNHDPQREWSRFDRHPFEFPVTLFFLNKYLKANSAVLDVGSGPGRYAIELAKSGHSVQLVDISQELLNIAQEKSKEAEVSISGFHLASATDLSKFGSESQDAVLCMGPMYHLTEQEDRDTAIKECLRTLKVGGLIYVAFISVLGRVYDIVRNYPDLIPTELERLAKHVTGPSVSSTDEQKFTDAYFIQPSEVESTMSAYPLKQLDILGVEGLTSQSENSITAVSEEVTKSWIEFAIKTAPSQAARYGSDHILYIAQKL